jgi:TonB family protein
VDIDENGATSNIEIIEPAGAGLDEHAVAAVQTWRFKPATKGGKPVKTRVAIEVDFRYARF